MSNGEAGEIRRVLDEELSLGECRRDSRGVEAAATQFFRDLFVERLNFEAVTSPRGDSPWQDLLVHEWPNTIRANAARLVARAGRFRVIYVELEELTPNTERDVLRCLTQSNQASGWTTGRTVLTVFHAPAEDTWHLVTPYEGATGDEENGRLVLRRYSLGEGETHRTVADALSRLDASNGRLAERIDEAFRVEPITEDFYEDYKHAFDTLSSELRENGLDVEAADRYAHVTLNRLLFCYFLQKNGLLGGRADFVRWFHERYEASDDEGVFHETWLSALFDWITHPEGTRLTTELPSDVESVVAELPYMSGLFHPSDGDELDVFLSDEALNSVIRGFLEQYTFTVREERPYDVDVAVDPSMLGKVYESLIAERERDEAGIFYTPRSEVDLLCRLALYEQVCDHVDDLDSERTRRIVEFVFSDPQEWDAADIEETEQLEQILHELRIVDPACGSGAFLVGMKQVLTELFEKVGSQPDDHRTAQSINESLYGVDIKAWAIRVAEFRLWLSHVEDGGRRPDTRSGLPPISSNLKVGDSLIQRRDEEGDAAAFSWDIDFADVVEDGGFDIVIGNPPYVRQEAITDQLIHPKRLEEMSDGEVSSSKKQYKDQLVESVEESFGITPDRRSDIYVYFYFKGLDLLRDGGTLAYLTSNSWLDVNYGRQLQAGLLRYSNLRYVLDTRATPMFGEADVNAVITVANRESEESLDGETAFLAFDEHCGNIVHAEAITSALVDEREDTREIVYGEETLYYSQIRHGRRVAVPASSLWKLGGGDVEEASTGARATGSYSVDSKWGIYLQAPDVYFRLLSRNQDELTPLAELTEDVFRGITSGANEFYFPDNETISNYGIDERYLSPLVKSPRTLKQRTIAPERLERKLLKITEPNEDALPRGIRAFIDWGVSQGYPSRRTVKRRDPWYDVGPDIKQTQILWQRTHYTKHAVYYAEKPVYVTDRFYGINVDPESYDPKVFAALLNSTFYALVKMLYSSEVSGRSIDTAVYEVESFPIPSPETVSDHERDALVDAFEALDQHEPEAIYDEFERDARRKLDEVVFGILAADQNERADVYRSVERLSTQIRARDRRR
ncbi:MULTISPECIES: Eco57I restriction-modification methylase domain-containing protein [Haloferax]|uniref:site-specific DNA-methyltransferase (adenine-specific) n=2 Tax=Haloferax TaxID=2251 RepID=A0A6G1YZL0_9EURY|nr:MULTISPECIES: DNA methyltransferase [Haloferax]KAB1187084.1 SAM-dependent DNA methyltransferase [Haloferax sp. CBA1149]MRW79720.1 N-6 DNA methylase [Haloferax marinisediminis]